MSSGWVKLHREILDSKLWSCSDATFRVAIYLLMSANHEARWVRRIQIERGQTVRSLTQIAADCKVSRKAARVAVRVLVQDEFITADEPFGAHHGTRVTVCKYETYQTNGDDKGTPGAHQGNNQGSNQGTQTRTKEVKEPKKTPLPPSGFLAFYSAWPPHPRKNKATALKAWTKQNCEPLAAEIVAALEKHKLSESWTKDKGEFIPAPSRWLNEQRWEDELPERHLSPLERIEAERQREADNGKVA